MLRNDADVFRSGVISLEAGMKFRSPHPVGGEVVGRHGGRVSPIAAPVEPLLLSVGLAAAVITR